MAIKITESVVREKIDGVKTYIFVGIISTIHLLYFLLFFGVTYVNPSYVKDLSIFIQVFICLFLAVRFHPFRKYSISKFDAMVIFSSASILFTNLVATELLAFFLGNKSAKENKTPNIIDDYAKKIGQTFTA